MKKYWNYQGTPVEFQGSKEELKKFESDNDHLRGYEVKKAEFEKCKKQNNNMVIARKRAATYPPIGDQLAIFWKFFASRRLRGGQIKSLINKLSDEDASPGLKKVLTSLADAIGDLTEDADKMLAQLNQVRKDNPYEDLKD
jgi:hypothetical protein